MPLSATCAIRTYNNCFGTTAVVHTWLCRGNFFGATEGTIMLPASLVRVIDRRGRQLLIPFFICRYFADRRRPEYACYCVAVIIDSRHVSVVTTTSSPRFQFWSCTDSFPRYRRTQQQNKQQSINSHVSTKSPPEQQVPTYLPANVSRPRIPSMEDNRYVTHEAASSTKGSQSFLATCKLGKNATRMVQLPPRKPYVTKKKKKFQAFSFVHSQKHQ